MAAFVMNRRTQPTMNRSRDSPYFLLMKMRLRLIRAYGLREIVHIRPVPSGNRLINTGITSRSREYAKAVFGRPSSSPIPSMMFMKPRK